MTNDQRAELINHMPLWLPYKHYRDGNRIKGYIGNDKSQHFAVSIVTGEITEYGNNVFQVDVDKELIACVNYMIGRLQSLRDEVS